MYNFKKYTHYALVFRQTTTTSGGYTKTEYVNTWKSYKWLLKATSLYTGQELRAFAKELRFHTEPDADIKESDKLIIDDQSYDVKGTSLYKWITFSSLQVQVALADNAW